MRQKKIKIPPVICLFKNHPVSETPLETIDLSPKIGVFFFFFLKRNIGRGKFGASDDRIHTKLQCMRAGARVIYIGTQYMHIHENYMKTNKLYIYMYLYTHIFFLLKYHYTNILKLLTQ